MFISRNSRNIFVKSVSFYLEWFQRYGELKKCTTPEFGGVDEVEFSVVLNQRKLRTHTTNKRVVL